MSAEIELNDMEKKKGGRPRAVIWNFFTEGSDQGDGHRSATCSACNTIWQRGKASVMERHILMECKKVKPEIKEAVRYIVVAREKSPENSAGVKRIADEDQKTLDEFYDTLNLSQEKKAKIKIALTKLFVCCGLSWRLVEHPFFIEFVKELRSSYDLPNRKTLAGTFLDDEILRVNTKIYRLLEKEKNLTLGKYLLIDF
jgi:hypothetical protein